MAFTRYTITDAGRDLMLACMASGDFRIHSLVVGDGAYSGDKTQIADVVNRVITFEGETLAVEKRGDQIEVRGKFTNELLEQGFSWREYGVYATDGTDVVLYCYDNAGDEPIPITAASAGAGISNTVKILLTIDQAAMVNVNFQPEPDIVLDNEVTAEGENAVTGAAVWAFAHTAGAIPAGSIGTGTLAGKVNANAAAAADMTVAQVRDIMLGTAAAEDMVGKVPAGTLYFTYKEV